MTRSAPPHADPPPLPATGDAALVEACLAGARGSWETLVRTYAPLVYAIPRRLGLTSDEAEDVSQAVFASLLQSLGNLRDGQSLAKWLIVVAKRQSWKLLRARPSRTEAGMPDEDAMAVAHRLDDPDFLWQRRHAVRQALSSLGDRSQELLVALFTNRNQPDYTEVSARLGIPVGSIGPTRNRCLKKLMDSLAAAPGGDGLWNEAEQRVLRGDGGDPT